MNTDGGVACEAVPAMRLAGKTRACSCCSIPLAADHCYRRTRTPGGPRAGTKRDVMAVVRGTHTRPQATACTIARSRSHDHTQSRIHAVTRDGERAGSRVAEDAEHATRRERTEREWGGAGRGQSHSG